MLQIVTERLPDIEIHYLGVDIDEKCCQQAREQLSFLKSVKAETFVLDFEQADCSKVDIPPILLYNGLILLSVIFMVSTAERNNTLSQSKTCTIFVTAVNVCCHDLHNITLNLLQFNICESSSFLASLMTFFSSK